MTTTRSAARRKAANLTLDPDLVAEARALGVNLSQAAEAGLAAAVKAAQEAEWRRENAGAIDSSNRWVAENGLPLGRHRPL